MTENIRRGPWTQCSQQQVYDNPWIEVKHEQVLTPAGTEGIYGTIHFKNLAIGIIPLDADDNTWLVKQFRYTLNEDSWEIPMGGGPLDVEPLLSAQRELREETGLQAQSWRELMRLHTSNSVTDELALVYVAEQLTQGEMELEETEDIELMKLPLQDALQMVMKGEITDAISVAALLRLSVERG
jgi:ADP-ribose pyrophosphatase